MRKEKALRESDIEEYLIARVKAAGGEVRKLKWIGRNNAMDRFVALRGAHLVEIKRPGKYLEPAQEREMCRLTNCGVSCFQVNSFRTVDGVIDSILKKS